MKQRHSEDQVVPYPKGRHFLEAAIRSTHHKPMIHGLLEVDVSRARAHLRGQLGPQLGPAITADFPDVLAALVKLAEG